MIQGSEKCQWRWQARGGGLTTNASEREGTAKAGEREVRW
jgi:hypothetical protein